MPLFMLLKHLNRATTGDTLPIISGSVKLTTFSAGPLMMINTAEDKARTMHTPPQEAAIARMFSMIEVIGFR